MQRFGRAFVFLLAFAILYSGPVAACVCAGDQSMPTMPCCPDQAHHAGQHDLGVPPSLVASCGPVAVGLLPASIQDAPAPVAIVATSPEPWRTRGPPPLPTVRPRTPLGAPPIYLVTLRLRN
jgi:hypothetical protein